MHYLSAIFSRLFSRKSPEDMAAAKELILKLVEENAVVLFGKSWCGFCTASRQLLNSLGAKYLDIDLDKREDGAAIQEALFEMTGQQTVPNIFLSHKHLGGNSDLQTLRFRLPKLLKDAGAV